MTFQFRPAVRENTPIEWRTIPSYPLYEASDEGQIRRRAPYPAGRKVSPLSPAMNAGYHYVSPGRGTHVGVHVLVCEAFHGPKPSERHQASHGPDRDRLNNKANNLRWDTPKNNQADRHQHGTAITGEAVNFAKLSTAQVREIRGRRGERTADIAREYGVTRENINSILRAATWRHL